MSASRGASRSTSRRMARWASPLLRLRNSGVFTYSAASSPKSCEGRTSISRM